MPDFDTENPDTTYLRFDAMLSEGLDIETRMGWETPFVHTKPKVDPDSKYRVIVMGKDKEILAETAPRVAFRHSCQSQERHDGEQIAQVEAYVPLAKGARELAFVRGDRTLWRGEIAKKAPKVSDINVDSNGERAQLSWSAKADRDVQFRVIAVVDKERSHVIELATDATKLDMELADLPAGPKGSEVVFTVMASDGVRSGWAASKPIKLEPRTPQIDIIEPAADHVLPAGTPTTIAVRLQGWTPRQKEPDSFRILVDNAQVAEGPTPLLIPALDPGKHTLRVEHAADKSVGLERPLIVAEPSDAMKRWMDVMQN